MRPALKNTATVFLLLLLAAPLFYVPTMEWRRASIRHEMKEQLAVGLYTQLTLSPAEVHWYRTGKEILHKGHMFDVEKQELLSNGMIRFTGMYDHKETALNDQLNKHQQQQDQKNSRQLAQFFNDWQAIPLATEESLPVTPADKSGFIHPQMDPVTAFSAILKPPPRA